MLEYHHPEPFPPEGTFVARIAAVLQVSTSQTMQGPGMTLHQASAASSLPHAVST